MHTITCEPEGANVQTAGSPCRLGGNRMRFIRGLRVALPLPGASLETWGGGAACLLPSNFIYIGDDHPAVADGCCYEEAKEQSLGCTRRKSESERAADKCRYKQTIGVKNANVTDGMKGWRSKAPQAPPRADDCKYLSTFVCLTPAGVWSNQLCSGACLLVSHLWFSSCYRADIASLNLKDGVLKRRADLTALQTEP